ncbi:hypothetical protein J5J10_08245 [Ciceribacter sp. L1K23]|uniref:hypothetical protein n=1 Tax=Ciceribacter sp. L1K23 TaxID=2820276 RepID=UPI001B83584D|nr:hypothetical protein [Ciceribacter sp. L1K23]MBR0555671.1 hypothetical protein [Ciceribacter sp. L1K23]
MSGHRFVLSLITAVAVLPTPVPAQESSTDAWTVEKCVRYDRAFNELLDFVGPEGVTADFVSGNRKFISDGCSSGADVCPVSDKDIELANALTIAAMGFGTASSFLPFVCRSTP